MSDLDDAREALTQAGLLTIEQVGGVVERMASDPELTWAEALTSLDLDESTVEVALDVVQAPARGVTDEAPERYVRLKGLGSGGMGTVDLVSDEHLSRRVARKELKVDNPAIATRFLREARITAQLEHPGIVPVYELGKRADGTLYYTMKRVRGDTLSAALARVDGLEDRLKLLGVFVDLCQAVAYAHSKGVVHRDLKPDNVMVGAFGETLVLDWGLAKVASEPEPEDVAVHASIIQSDDTNLTQAGSVLGTPLYMSPEQARGGMKDVDARSDVWSLGVILHEILVGSPPFSGPMNLLIPQVQTGVVPPIEDRSVPRELAAIAHKALSKEPRDRYANGGELAAEIEAWRAGAVVSAYDYSAVERVHRLVMRYRVALGIGALLAVSSVVTFGLWRSAVGAAAVAEERSAAARQQALVSEARLAAQQGRDHESIALYRAAIEGEPRAELRRELAALAWPLGARTMLETELTPTSWTFDGTRAYLSAPAPTSYVHLLETHTLAPRQSLSCPERAVAVAGSEDLLVVACQREVRVFDTISGALRHRLVVGVRTNGVQVAGQRLLTVSSDQQARVFDLTSGKEIASHEDHGEEVFVAWLSSDGRRALTQSASMFVDWDLEADATRAVETRGGLRSIPLGPDRIGMPQRDGFRIWDLSRGEVVQKVGCTWPQTVPDVGFRSQFLSSDSPVTLGVICRTEAGVSLLDADGEVLGTVDVEGDGWSASSDGRWVLDGRELIEMLGDRRFEIPPLDGEWELSVFDDVLWAAAFGEDRLRCPLTEPLTCVEVSPRSPRTPFAWPEGVFFAATDGWSKRDADGGVQAAGRGELASFEVAEDGGALLVRGDGTGRWVSPTGEEQVIDAPGEAVAAGRQTVVTRREDGTLVGWRSGESVWELPQVHVESRSIGEAGRLVLHDGKQLRILDIDTGAILHEEAWTVPPTDVGVAADGTIGLCSRDGEIWTWRGEGKLRELTPVKGHYCFSVVFTGDRMLAGSALSGEVTIYSVGSGEVVAELSTGGEGGVFDLTVVGDWLWAGGTDIDDALFVWTSLESGTAPVRLKRPVGRMSYLEQVGERLFVAGGDESTLHLWQSDLPSLEETPSWAGRLSSYRVCPDTLEAVAVPTAEATSVWAPEPYCH